MASVLIVVRRGAEWRRALFSAVGVIALGLASGPLARAQEEKPAAEPAPAPVPAPEAEATPPPPPESVPAEDETAEPVAESESNFVWFVRSSGIFGFLIILMSVTMVALIIRMFLEFRVKEAIPPALVDRLDAAIRDRKFQEAYDACREDPSILARLVRTGVANLPMGRNEAKEAMSATAEEIVVGMEGRNNYLATIGTIGPMLGLLGTVQGMISAFHNLATVSGVQVDPQTLAGNISLALVTTLEGLIVAVPAIFFYQFFRGRIIYLVTESSKIAERTINAFWQAANPAKPSPSVSSPKPTA